jgi:hypothetical protein
VNQNWRRILLKIKDFNFGCLLTFILIIFLLGKFGLGWVVNGFLIAIALLLITPVIIFWLVRWWLKRNLIEDQCPVCNYQFTGFNNIQCRCPNCGELLEVKSGKFYRITPPGTIDVDVIDVSTRRLED